MLNDLSDAHSDCLCTTHQNVKLMIKSTKLNAVTNGKMQNYK